MKKFAPLAVIVAVIGLLVFIINKPSSQSNTQLNLNTVASTNIQAADKELIVVTPWEITSLDPSKSGFVYQRLQLVETLVDADSEGKLISGLAKQWTSNDTATEWIFVLQDGVKFHDGTQLHADNVVQSIKVALSKPTALESAKIQDVVAIDDKTVKFVLEKPLYAFPAYLAHSTAVILAAASFDDKGEIKELIGTGPYQVIKVEPPQKVEQVAFVDYWGQKANINHITYLANSRSESRALLAQSEPNYMVFNLDAASLSRLQADSDISLQSKSIARTIQYKVNAKLPPFDDVKFRQILSRAIDRQGIAESVLNIKDGAATQILPPLFAEWQISTPNDMPDYQALKQELLALGYSQDDKGKLLDKQGKAVKFTLKTFSDRPELPVVATALQAQFAKLGIEVDVAVGNFSDIPASHQNGTLEMALYARNYGLVPNPLGALMEDFAPFGSDWGVMNWKNDALSQALAELNSTNDNNKALKQQISQIIYDEQPITPVVYYQQNVATNKALQHVEIDALERNFKLSQLAWSF